MNPIQQYTDAMLHRQDIIRANAGRRLATKKLPQIPVPPKPEQPMSIQLTDCNGDYAGTWPHGVTLKRAIEEAEEAGLQGPFKSKLVPASR